MKLATTIHDHPWASVAVAFGVGAALAMRPKSAIARALISTAVGTAFAVAKELASDRMATYARSWVDQRVRPAAATAS